MSPRLVCDTETPMTRGERWAAICALIAQGRGSEVKACEAKSEEGEMLLLDEAYAYFDRVVRLLADEDADPMIAAITKYFDVVGETV